MWLFEKALDLITKDDFNQLLQDGTTESTQLEYKEIIPPTNQKDEFRSDVVAMANSRGGLIVFGASEKSGRIGGLPGIDRAAIDASTRTLESWIRAGIEPKLSSYSFRELPLTQDKSLLLLKISRSLNMPHRVVENKRFLIRHTNRKDDMNIEELRSAFTLSSNFTEKVDYWIAERVKQILHIENPIMTDPVQRLMLFIVPLSSFESGQSIDVANMARQIHLIQPIASSHETGRFILEGFIAHGESFGKDGEEVDYVKLFRSGKIEAVDRHYIARSNTLKMYGFESTILCSLAGYLRALKLLEVSPPFSIRIILDGVQGYTFTIDPRHDWDLRPHAPHEMTRNSFFLPGVLINEWSECDDLPRVMKPIFDAVWNCCNWEGSPNYKGMTYTRQSEWVQVNGK